MAIQQTYRKKKKNLLKSLAAKRFGPQIANHRLAAF
jgi:hypothetical protein